MIALTARRVLVPLVLLWMALAVPPALAQAIDTLAGNGTAGFDGDSGQATAASLNLPQGVATDAAGNVYIADRNNHRIRRVDAAGVVTTFAGTGVAGFGGDGGTATDAQLNGPVGLATDASGNLYIADFNNHRVRRVSGGIITTVAGTGTPGYTGDNEPATSSGLAGPTGVAWSGELYIADLGNHRIRRVNGGMITTVAGTGSGGFSGDGGAATAAALNFPISVTIGGDGFLYVADYFNQRIRRFPLGGNIATVAGNGTATFAGDGGAATAASLNNPTYVVRAASGDLYIADNGNHRIRKVASGVISTLAGTGTATFGGDGGPPAEASLSEPVGLAFDFHGDLLIADSSNHRVRVVTFPRAPDAPVIGTATAGDAQISVEFTPGDDGGTPILEFVATCAAESQAGTVSPIVVGGLVNGVAYNCTVVAVNAAGTSPSSDPSNDATPLAVTMTAITGPASSSLFDPVSFIATVTGSGLTGTVAFYGPGLIAGCEAQALVAGEASCDTAFTVPGGLFVHAVYSGDATHAASTSTPLLHSVGGGYDLAVTRSGTGTGSVSSPAGIDCGGDCSQEIAPLTSVTLTASPGVGSTFVGWSGVTCAEGQASLACTFTLTTNVTANAAFDLLTYTVTAGVNGAAGIVSMNITTCGPGCAVVSHGTSITFTALPDGGSAFAGWGGVTCNEGNSSAVCTVAVTANTSAVANFGYEVSVTKGGMGEGDVTSSPSGISCGAACSYARFVYMPGTTVTLTAVGLPGSTFTGWASGPCSGTGPCVITVGPSAAVLAQFSMGEPVVAPSVPRLASATGGNGEVTLRFAPPASDGGDPVTYHASCTPGIHTATGAASPMVITGLANGTSYACVVTALNSAGPGPSTSEMTATPLPAVTGPLAYIATPSGVAVVESATYLVHATVGVPAVSIDVNPSATRAFFTESNSDVVHVIDTATSSIIASIPFSQGPYALTLAPAGDRLYVSNWVPSRVDVVDTTSLAVVDSIPVAGRFLALAVSPDGSRLYGNLGGGALHVIDLVTHSVSVVPIGFAQSLGLAVNPAGTRVYVTGKTSYLGQQGTVVIDTATLAIEATVPTFDALGVDVSPTGSRTYVVSNKFLVALDNATHSPVAQVGLSGDQFFCEDWCFQGVVAAYPDNTRILAGYQGWSPSAGLHSGFRVVDAATFAVIASIDASLMPMGIAIAPTVPGAPTIGTATPGSGALSIAFTPPALNGGSRITGYTVTCNGTQSASGAASPILVSGLVDGVSHACSVTATNAVGTGAPSASVNGTPISIAVISTQPASSLAFASRPVGSSSPFQQVMVTSGGTIPLLVGQPTIAGANAGDFAVSSSCFSVAPGDSCAVEVIFTPQAAGARTASLDIPSNDPARPLTSITLSGIGIADTTPDAFTFTGVTGVARGSIQTSNPVTISGINVPANISVAGGVYSIGCTATFVTTASTISSTQTVCVRHVASSLNATATNTTLTVGGVSDTFTSTTTPAFTLTTATSGTGTGTITGQGINCPGDCSELFDSGTPVTLTAVQGAQSTFTGWSGGGCSGTGNTCLVAITASVTISATFALNQYTVTPSAGANGTISPNTPQTVNHGATRTFTVTPSAGFSAAVGGTCGGNLSGTTYTTNAITANCTVTASFTLEDPPRLSNISTRMQVLTANDVMIGGFVIDGTGNKTVVVRARGPSLIPFGITNALANPQLQLVRSSDQVTIATNDDWQSAANQADVAASGFAPGNALEAAILMQLAPGAYTAIVSGVANGTGVGIVEVFEVDGPLIPLANISTRGQVLTGNDVMIGGFVIQGNGPQTVVVRARGPSLIPFGITNALVNPRLQLVRSSDQSTVATNDNWLEAANAGAIGASGFAPSGSLEAAILVTLPPGAYTAIVSGVGGRTGVAIVEVFRLN